MEKAKAAVSSFLSHDGKHRTTVDEDVRAAVTEEHIKPHQHENVTTVVDKEVHQDHHHTTIQPIKHTETLPEQHHHNMAAVEHRNFDHGNERDLRATLDRDAARYKDTSVTHHTTTSTSSAPIVTGERIHHHVHEHVQPVIQKEVIAPQVVHTTVPIHETHHLAAQHHGTSVLPVKTLEEFTSGAKGALEGRHATKLNEYEGCPKPYKKELQQEQLEGDRGMHVHAHEGQHHSHAGAVGTGVGAAAAGGALRKHKHRKDPNRVRSGSSSSSASSSDEESRQRRTTNKTTGLNNTNTSTNTAAKPSLLDRLNPMKDTDHDGKKGVLE